MNWKHIIQQLLDKGFTQKQIAQRIGCNQSYVSELFNGLAGKSLSWALGDALIRFHNEVCPQQPKVSSSGVASA
jgi:hypothetical protein